MFDYKEKIIHVIPLISLHLVCLKQTMKEERRGFDCLTSNQNVAYCQSESSLMYE